MLIDIATTAAIPVIAASLLMALASVLRVWIAESSRTRRLIRALEGSKPNQRAGIILACSHLEGRPAEGPSSDTDGVPLERTRSRLPTRIPLTGRQRKGNGD